jgi:pimeloyl-ACP methyl ester carboxylesterase
MWDLQMKTLLKRYRVLRYDTRGHGQSDVPAAPYSFDDLVGDQSRCWITIKLSAELSWASQ